MTRVESFIRSGEFRLLNDFIDATDVGIIDPVVAMAILRSSSRAKDCLPGWMSLLCRTTNAMSDDDRPRLLIGMPWKQFVKEQP
jgi:hypothetical protein